MSANALRLRLSLLAVSRTESELRINAPCNALHASLDDAHTKKKTNRMVRFSLCWCGLRFANCAIAPACVRTQHFVLHLLAMSTVLDFRKCCALASLFACGLPRLAQQRLLPKVNRVQRTVPVPTMQALLPANCSICRGSSSSVSAKKEKTRTKFVLIFLWCGLRKTNGC